MYLFFTRFLLLKLTFEPKAGRRPLEKAVLKALLLEPCPFLGTTPSSSLVTHDDPSRNPGSPSRPPGHHSLTIKSNLKSQHPGAQNTRQNTKC